MTRGICNSPPVMSACRKPPGSYLVQTSFITLCCFPDHRAWKSACLQAPAAAEQPLAAFEQTCSTSAQDAPAAARPEPSAEACAADSMLTGMRTAAATDSPVSVLPAHLTPSTGSSPSSHIQMPQCCQAGSDIAGDADDECVVCWAKNAAVIFRPCGHLCCCLPCAQPFQGGLPCPMCRRAVESSIAL